MDGKQADNAFSERSGYAVTAFSNDLFGGGNLFPFCVSHRMRRAAPVAGRVSSAGPKAYRPVVFCFADPPGYRSV